MWQLWQFLSCLVSNSVIFKCAVHIFLYFHSPCCTFWPEMYLSRPRYDPVLMGCTNCEGGAHQLHHFGVAVQAHGWFVPRVWCHSKCYCTRCVFCQWLKVRVWISWQKFWYNISGTGINSCHKIGVAFESKNIQRNWLVHHMFSCADNFSVLLFIL